MRRYWAEHTSELQSDQVGGIFYCFFFFYCYTTSSDSGKDGNISH